MYFLNYSGSPMKVQNFSNNIKNKFKMFGFKKRTGLKVLRVNNEELELIKDLLVNEYLGVKKYRINTREAIRLHSKISI